MQHRNSEELLFHQKVTLDELLVTPGQESFVLEGIIEDLRFHIVLLLTASRFQTCAAFPVVDNGYSTGLTFGVHLLWTYQTQNSQPHWG